MMHFELPAAILAYGGMTDEQRLRARMPRAHRLSNNTEWFKVTAHADGSSTRLDLYDEIGFWGVTAGDFRAAMDGIGTDQIDMHINSPGGDVFDGIAILNLLRAHPAAVNVTVDGLAASAASFIAMAGDTVTMMPNSEMMIHDAQGVCIGSPKDMGDMQALLARVSDNIASVYAARAGGTAEQWRAAMQGADAQGEQWYSDKEAVAAGLADSVMELPAKKKASSTNAWNFNFYAHHSRESAPPPTIIPAAAPAPVADVAPVFVFDPQQLRDAMKEAAQL